MTWDFDLQLFKASPRKLVGVTSGSSMPASLAAAMGIPSPLDEDLMPRYAEGADPIEIALDLELTKIVSEALLDAAATREGDDPGG
jgi:hypothetical protein